MQKARGAQLMLPPSLLEEPNSIAVLVHDMTIALHIALLAIVTYTEAYALRLICDSTDMCFCKYGIW